MKVRKIGIKWKIFIYMLGFIGVLLALLWIFQTMYLDEFYKMIKKNELENAFSNVETILGADDMTEGLELVASRYDICVVVVDQYGNEMYSSEQNTQCYVHKMRRDEIIKLINKAAQNDGTYSETIKGDDISVQMPSRDNMFDWFVPDRFHGVGEMVASESIIKINLYERADGMKMAVIINSVITPVDATVQTIRVQLVCISVIMVILALIMAIIISYKVSKPIVKINKSASRLGKGDYTVTFDGQGYKEIAQLSDTLNYATIELAKAEGLQRELLANVSHDLRTPLTMITAYSEVMRDLPGENTPENVQVVIDEAKRLTTLVNDLLDISKLQAGVAELELKVYDLTESIQSVIDRYAKFMEQNGYKIKFDFDRHVTVYADEYKIYQVIYNLVNNAINYTGEDKTVIVTQRVAGSIVRIEVADTGAGIAVEELENVWERYYKVDKSHKRAMMGTGLGLSIVKNVLKLHHAQFGVSSKENEGTIFWFELKVAQMPVK